ncbi:ATP-binding protein [Nonomuraea sp. NPDC050536]|uniref:ATP-binding protein n=1 Tax=Nonomuraea sp. NPDC050536 TaxID=3364366 RepID=UPI0037C8F5EC
MPEMQLDFDGLIQVVAKNLYAEKKVFIRELIQNAHDSIKRRAHADPGVGQIDIETRPQELVIAVRDNGIGMDRDDLVDYLSNVGSSLTKREGAEIEGLIGQFGIGFLSAFVVARKVEVRTRKQGAEEGWLWENEGSKEYRLEPCPVPSAGTTVTVFLRDETDRGLIQESEVRDLIRKYADMLAVPIHLNGAPHAENQMGMPWEKTGLTRQELQIDCHTYVQRTFNDLVLEAIPVRLEAPVRANGVLYISKTRVIDVDQPRTVRVFQNRMFLCENASDVLPQWARFVNGIIDTPDLTPTAARDNFIRDDTTRMLQEALGDLVIEHLQRLREEEPSRFSDIALYHRLGFAAACYYYPAFFEKFADLLLWRTNLGQEKEELKRLVPTPELLHRLRTLPEILSGLPEDGGRKRLACFTTLNTAAQYFEIANAAGTTVVDASHFYEEQLLEAYTRLPGVAVDLVHVDRQEDRDIFRPLERDDRDVLRLAETMSLTLRTPFGGKISAEARRFKPAEIHAILRADARTTAQQKADEVRRDPNAASYVREIAEELARLTETASPQRLTINADNPLVRRMAQQDLNDPVVRQLMNGLYNSAVIAHGELITSSTLSAFQAQFHDLMSRSLDFLEGQAELREAQARLRVEEERRRATTGPQPRHRIVFLITPFAARYQPLIEACRQTVEERWGCQLIVGGDVHDDPRLLENLRLHMGKAHAFLAEITDANPNVMYELGVAHGTHSGRPVVLLREGDGTAGDADIPSDLKGMLYIPYSSGAGGQLTEHLDREIRKSTALRELVEGDGWATYLSPGRLQEKIRPLALTPEVIKRLANRFPTVEDWQQAGADEVAAILGPEESEFAEILIGKAGKPQ